MLPLVVAAGVIVIPIPVPNTAKPAALEQLIARLEYSAKTRALAYVAEDKLFGSRSWVWGFYEGDASQEEADRRALERCELALARAKRPDSDGKPRYDFGHRSCELHRFAYYPVAGVRSSDASVLAAGTDAREASTRAVAPEVPATAASARSPAADTPTAESAAADETLRFGNVRFHSVDSALVVSAIDRTDPRSRTTLMEGDRLVECASGAHQPIHEPNDLRRCGSAFRVGAAAVGMQYLVQVIRDGAQTIASIVVHSDQ